MKALSCFVAAFLLLVAVGSSFAQTSNDDRLIENVKAAEAELDTAKRLLAEARAEGEPLIARMAQLVERRKQLSDELDRALDASKRAQDNIKRIPAALEARRNALMDTISRMYRFGDPDSEIRKREAALAEIEAQIAAYETGVNQTRADADRAYEHMEEVFAEKRRLDAEIDRLGLEVAMARGSIDGSETRLARAEEQLEIARDQARWEFNKNPPPFLSASEWGPRIDHFIWRNGLNLPKKQKSF